MGDTFIQRIREQAERDLEELSTIDHITQAMSEELFTDVDLKTYALYRRFKKAIISIQKQKRGEISRRDRPVIETHTLYYVKRVTFQKQEDILESITNVDLYHDTYSLRRTN